MTKISFDADIRRISASGGETVPTHNGRVHAAASDYLVIFDEGRLAFTCSPEQYERLFAEKKEKPKTSETTFKSSKAK